MASSTFTQQTSDHHRFLSAPDWSARLYIPGRSGLAQEPESWRGWCGTVPVCSPIRHHDVGHPAGHGYACGTRLYQRDAAEGTGPGRTGNFGIQCQHVPHVHWLFRGSERYDTTSGIGGSCRGINHQSGSHGNRVLGGRVRYRDVCDPLRVCHVPGLLLIEEARLDPNATGGNIAYLPGYDGTIDMVALTDRVTHPATWAPLSRLVSACQCSGAV